MRLQRIYSSKLYVTSTRKDKIRAAIDSDDAWNVELVQQLSDYLGEKAQAELRYAINEEKQEEAASGNDETTSSGESSRHEPMGGGGPSFSGDPLSDFGDDELADVEPLPEEGGEEAPAEIPEEAPVEESTSVTGQPITATSTVWTTIEDVVSECDTIQGTLNAREDTKGVTRLQVKDNELWIYFNDDSNLNDKMIDVIEVINSTGYTYLKFNRLARSNNAIVFDVNLNTTPIMPESEIKDEK